MNLKLNRVGKSFSQGSGQLRILSNLDLDLPSGEVAAVVGESGSGKSTMLSVMAGFEPADEGEITWDGVSSKGWSEDNWALFRRHSLGFVFQNYYLIPYLTALENVALPLRLNGVNDCEEQAREYLRNVGLAERLSHLPNQMSGGECQRVAIARALIHNPKLLLADEPTGSLDSKTGAQVLDILFNQIRSKKQTALMVTHSMEVANRCDRIFTLKEGRLWPYKA